MTKRKKELSKTQRLIVLAVLDALKTHDCINAYTIDGESVQPQWQAHGVTRAFQELQTAPHPLGLKKKNERAWLYLLLVDADKTIGDYMLSAFKQRHNQ